MELRPAPPLSASLRHHSAPHRTSAPRPTAARPAVQRRPVLAPVPVPHQFRTVSHRATEWILMNNDVVSPMLPCTPTIAVVDVLTRWCGIGET